MCECHNGRGIKGVARVFAVEMYSILTLNTDDLFSRQTDVSHARYTKPRYSKLLN